MSDLVAWVSTKIDFLHSAAVYVILHRHKKPAHVILEVVLMLYSSSIVVDYADAVIFSRMSFVIGRHVDFVLGDKVLPPLIIHARQRLSKTSRGK